MRDYSKIASTFWTGVTGKALRGAPELQIVAMYLLTSPHATMVGVFTCPVLYVAHETGLAQVVVEQALSRLEQLDFCLIDRERDLIWVREMARFQIGDALSPGDKRVKNVASQFAKIPASAIREGFAARYGAAFHLTSEGASKGHTKGHGKGHPNQDDAPPKQSAEPEMPLRSQEQKQEQNPSDLTVGPADPAQQKLQLGIREVLDQPSSARIVATKPETANPLDPLMAKRDLYARAEQVAGPGFGGQITKLLQKKGGNVAEARSVVEKASNANKPKEYIAKVIRGDDTGLPAGQLYHVGL